MKRNHKRGDTKTLAIFNKTKFRETRNSNHVEVYGESTVPDMPIFKIELASNPNSYIIKINKQIFRALLDSGAEVSLVHTKVYKSVKK